MDQNFIEEMRKKLETERDRVKTEIERVAKKSRGDKYKTSYPEYGSKEDENAAEVTEFEERLSLERNLEDLLESINSALAKIEKGDFGICEKCGKEIDRARLEVSPSSALCLECQEASERGVFNKIKKLFGK